MVVRAWVDPPVVTVVVTTLLPVVEASQPLHVVQGALVPQGPEVQPIHIVSHACPPMRGVWDATYQTRYSPDIPSHPTSSSTDPGSNRPYSRSPRDPSRRGPRGQKARIHSPRPNRAHHPRDHHVHHHSDPSPRAHRWSSYPTNWRRSSAQRAAGWRR